MTARLYYDDAYLRAFDAHVAAASEDGLRLYLDRTAFYPTSGGQPHDTGELAGARVVDVVDEGERIAHVLEAPADVRRGAAVEGRIDWERRLDHMQQHTGQHLLSAVFAELYGAETVSVHFGAESSTLDLGAESLAPKQLEAAEARANALVWENRPVTVGYEDAAQAAGLRKTPAREGPLRIVTIEGVDRSACGGTHVRGTAEIGPVLLRGVERLRGNTRVGFVCGGRAIRAARADHALLQRLALDFSARPEELPALAAALRERERELRAALKKGEEELAGHRARALYERTAPDPAGVRRAVERRADGGLEQLRALAHAFIALPRAVLVGVVEDPPAVLLAASEDSGIDAGPALKRVVTEAGGRGGGSARVAQGSVPDRKALEVVVRALSG